MCLEIGFWLLLAAGYWLYLDAVDGTTRFVEARRAGPAGRRLSFELGFWGQFEAGPERTTVLTVCVC
jgi:hypothetical protein